MLIKHPALDAVTIYVISQDAVFARMLEIELCEAGMNAVRVESFPEESTTKGKLQVFTASSEVLAAEPHRSVPYKDQRRHGKQQGNRQDQSQTPFHTYRSFL